MDLLDTDRLHQTLALFLSVTGIYVDMFAVETFWTMIGVTRSEDLVTAIITNKVFNFFCELFHCLKKMADRPKMIDSVSSVRFYRSHTVASMIQKIFLVRLEGIEPPSTVPKTVALSVELQTLVVR